MLLSGELAAKTKFHNYQPLINRGRGRPGTEAARSLLQNLQLHPANILLSESKYSSNKLTFVGPVPKSNEMFLVILYMKHCIGVMLLGRHKTDRGHQYKRVAVNWNSLVKLRPLRYHLNYLNKITRLHDVFSFLAAIILGSTEIPLMYARGGHLRNSTLR